MSFTFHCPFCNQELEAEENWIGQETACPNCSKTIKIIKNSENSVQNLHSDEISCPHCGATIKKAAKICRFCHKELNSTVANNATSNQPILSMCKECGSFIKTTSSRIGQSMACPMCGEDMVIEKAENRTCPSCGESIKIEAKICKFCHSQLPPINAIGEKGNKIESMYSSALLQSDLVFPVPDAALRNEMSDLWKKLHLWFILGCSSLFLGALTVAILIGIPILIFSIVASVFVIIFNCKLLYRYWKYVGPKPGWDIRLGKWLASCLFLSLTFTGILRYSGNWLKKSMQQDTMKLAVDLP